MIKKAIVVLVISVLILSFITLIALIIIGVNSK